MVEAQQRARIHADRLSSRVRARLRTLDLREAAIRKGLRELGYVEGQNIVDRVALWERRARSAARSGRRILWDLKLDVILVSGAREPSAH